MDKLTLQYPVQCVDAAVLNKFNDFRNREKKKKKNRKTEACRQSQAKTRLKKFSIQPSLEFWQLWPEFQDVTQIFLNHHITV